MEKFSWKGHGAMLAANCIWGLMAPVAKIVMAGSIITPLVLTDLRVFGAMVLFWVASLFRKPEKVEPKDMMRLFAASLLAIVFNQGLYVFGVSLTSPADASIITTSMPLWAMVLAAIFLKEPITGKKVGGIAFGAGGALLLILGGSHAAAAQAGSTTNIGEDLFVLLAQLSYASYLVLYKNFVNKYSIFTIMKWMFTYAFICLLPFSYHDIIATDWAALTWGNIGSILYVVVLATFLCYVLVVVGQKNLRPTVAGMYNYIQPIVSVTASIFLGLDTFSYLKVLAVLLIFTGVWLVTASKSRAQMEREEAA